MMWSNYPTLSLIAFLLLSLLLMYFVRAHAHTLIARVARLLHSQLRLLSRACLRTAQRIRLRNHEVTKALAESLMERQLERRFMRIEKLVERDLASYQQLSAEINRQLVTIDEDYAASANVPEVSPEWVTAVEAIANLQGDDRNTEVMAKILDDMHKTVKQHQRDALREHRWTVSARHKVLSGLQPRWRKLTKLLQNIDNNIDVLRHRLRQVDQHMGQFEMLTAGSGQGVMSSMLMRFVSSLCFVIVGIGAAWINWQLISQPLQELLPVRQLDGVSLAAVVAGLHIAFTIVAATLISESLRITHLFPMVSAMTRRGRQLMMFSGAGLLLALISVEIMALLGAPIVNTATQLTGVSQILLVVIGLVMPLVLSMVMLPMEYLLHTLRPVVGSGLQILSHMAALILRLAASLSLQAGALLVNVYDLLIFLPLRVERELLLRAQRNAGVEANPQMPNSSEVEPLNVTTLKFGTGNNEQRH
ncbi:hypothetical protein [Oceanicoccus sagamiensis]|uniref:Uncharacterized protein n=1 Tax=Oceanicoccus sagamiensis TaxID=716816 RepID=A0A1X9NAU5_9GAMM|nr:hypothetical protein [Oceanicoccus sagamiensis]ARN73045.1 hypothetical protein BST96_02325 [Oceanicoccus sagamiensis]